MKESSEICKYEFYVKGMHCPSCEIVVEKSLSKHKDVNNVKADLTTQKVSVELTSPLDKEIITTELNALLKETDYEVSQSTLEVKSINYKQLLYSFVIASLFILFFLVLQKLKIINLVNTDSVTYPFVFFIGVVASLSSCMAVVGGLVLSLSSTYAKSKTADRVLPMSIFHISRILSFFLLGGVIGLLGSAFTLTPETIFVMNLILFLVMIIMGINLLDIFPKIRNLQVRMPKKLSSKLMDINTKSSYIAPVLLGASTFFLPCGFTQSMQIYSLTTGNFINGAITMLIFALGTFPVLALISLASIKLSKGFQSGIFFKTSGFIVLFFALLSFIGALTAIGLTKPILNI